MARKKIALLVIHGIGEQKPFETLDAFMRPLAREYARLFKVPVSLKHDLVWMNNWGESCISLTPAAKHLQPVDVFEYYWSHLTQRKITAAEVIEWLFRVARGAQAYYDRQRRHHSPEAERNDLLFKKDGEFDHLEYLVRLLSLGGLLKYFYLFVIKITDALPFLKSLRKVLGFAANLLKPFLYGKLVDFMGDVALYCSTDLKSEYYAVRKAILDGAVEKAKWLVMNGQYEKVFICGHSLGSVIAYDIFDRLNLLMSHDAALRARAAKLGGMATFGSPLDKIAFFFDERVDAKKEPLRYSILSQLHGFRRKNVDQALPTSVTWRLGRVAWLNFWTPTDIVSGHLDTYAGVKNIKMDFSDSFKNKPLAGTKLFIFSHLLYWESPAMFENILRAFIKPLSGRPGGKALSGRAAA